MPLSINHIGEFATIPLSLLWFIDQPLITDNTVKFDNKEISMNKLIPKVLIISTTLFAILLSPIAYPADYRLDVSLDTSPNHIRNQSFRQFAQLISKKSNGRLELRIFDSASKYKGPNVATAVAQGAIDMAAPAQQHLSKYIPNAGLLLLPMFYGLEREKIYLIVDGPLGQQLNKEIEEKLHIIVLGRPFDLGYGTVFSTQKRITTPSDMQGMKVRVPGGAATVARYKVFGSTPTQIAWSDVPQALQTGTVSSIWATQESVASAKLWDSGIRYAFEDKQAVIEYVPIISAKAWNKLPADLQTLLRTTWEDMVDEVRQAAFDKQRHATELNKQHGIETVIPTQQDLNMMREKLLKQQPAIIKKLKMNPMYIQQVQDQLNAS